MRAPYAANEVNRIRALQRAAILDTPPEPVFDELVELAAHVCHTPISTVTFVDADRQWFKARLGLPVSQTPRDISFCAHAILGDEPLIVPDATKDRRFAGMPAIAGGPCLRFYAGAPLVGSKGYAVGTICVMDREPRTLSEDQRRALRTLAAQAVSYLELRVPRPSIDARHS